MSFSFDPIPATGAARPVSATSPAARTAQASAARRAEAVTVDTRSVSPPAEVLDAIGTAAQVADRLAASGRSLRFSVDVPTGRVSVQVADHTGAALGSLTVAQALAVAAGQPVA